MRFSFVYMYIFVTLFFDAAQIKKNAFEPCTVSRDRLVQHACDGLLAECFAPGLKDSFCR